MSPLVGWLRSQFRGTALRIGLLTGLCTFALVVGGVLVFDAVMKPPYNLEVLVNGSDVSQHGGGQLVFGTAYAPRAFVATCNGVCDDLGYRAYVPGEAQYKVSVVGAAADCIDCDSAVYMDNAMPSLARGRIAGRDRLRVTWDRIDRPT